MEEYSALFNHKSSKSFDLDLEYSTGVCHCFVQE